jgi:Rrf2 family protein
MKITFKGDYALKTILELSRNYEAGVVTIPDLARRTDIPRKFLEQIMLDLKKGGFVESKRGKDGGYTLSRQPGKITVGEVVRFIEGPIEPIACVDDCYKGCKDAVDCVFRDIWVRVAKETSKIVDHTTFEDLLHKVKVREKALDFAI